MSKLLSKILDAELDANGQGFYHDLVPNAVVSNLKPTFAVRPYQYDAFGRFAFYWDRFADRPKDTPMQLLYHMATGSGKTLIMAGLILYLYGKGYRNFLFFVNSANIIEKTRDNFLNPLSSKYLFAETISFADRQIRIREVSNFQHSDPDDINISFNTVQGLHSSLNTPRENSLTFDDFESNKLVLISDEAHHINAETKKGKELTSDDVENLTSWEATISRILNANPENVMLEFTATADLANSDIAAKYQNKLLFDYPLRQFRADGYSKDVQTLQADLPLFERAVQAILLSQYRRKLFEKNGLVIKPVVLFKSKTIKDSHKFQSEFISRLKTLTVDTLMLIKEANADTVVNKAFDYCAKNSISLENLIEEIKVDFGEDKQISVNSKEESEAKQIAINSLEDESNGYRAIFAVDKLNEGWDVLNLFDIVRLYDTRDAKKGAPGKTTMQEAQLIGRGARYCPFRTDASQPLFVRKYDNDESHELRICEELFYHASYNPRYIQELNTALVEIGIKASKYAQREVKIKDSFMQTAFYRNGFLFKNVQEKCNRHDVYGLENSIIQQAYRVKLHTGAVSEDHAFKNNENEKRTVKAKDQNYRLLDFGERVIRKAISKLDFYRFDNLQKHLPNLKSIAEFIASDSYLGKINVTVNGLATEVANLTPQQKLDAATEVLEKVSATMVATKSEFNGSEEFKPYLIRNLIKDIQLKFPLDEGVAADKEFGRSMCDPKETDIYLDLSSCSWYAQSDCFGSSEEKHFIKYIESLIGKLKEIYDDIYLIKNEHYFKVYSFEAGSSFEPDFVLFLTKRKGELSSRYQIFIETKSANQIKQDRPEELFLQQISQLAKLENQSQDCECSIFGMPFFSNGLPEQKDRFKKVFTELLF